VELLLRANADVNAAAGSDGLTALQLAEYYGHSKIAEVLKANADPTTSTRMAGYWFMMAGPSVVQEKVVFVIQSFNFCITFIHCIAGVFL
jgi:ankyrin repeat protein